MYPKTCFCLFLVCLAAVQAVPAGKVEQKSVADQPTKTMEGIQLEETGDDKDRLKKAASFCVEIRPGAENDQQSSQDKSQLQVQGLNVIQQSPQVQTYSIQSAGQPVQALNVVQGTQLASQQSFVAPQQYFVPQMIPQQVVSQVIPSSVVQQQVVPSVQTLQIIQPSQPCPQQAVVQVEPKSQTIAVTTPKPEVVTVPSTPKPVPEKIIVPQTEIVETVKYVPVPPVCNEKLVVLPPKPMVVVPEPTVVKIPHCQHQSQGLVSQCNCGQQGIGAFRSAVGSVNPMHFMAVRKPMPAPYAKMMNGAMKM
ncbi:uncharacterized protein LOC116425845 [Nomia melanderi]|uniref:uncharacterized protein LOC116425845 n=1 Tax=Nomia melanderi TaxID=2448451 RepID=UPI0013040040|nr:E3 ubiquitin-protein ligase RNF12-B-like [Nomia melanderi]